MLLDMDISDILNLIESPETLNLKIKEAIQVFEYHSKKENEKNE